MTIRRGARSGVGSELDLFPAPEPPPTRAQHLVEEPLPSYVGSATYPGETAEAAIAVSILTEAARDILEGAFIPVWVRGEITDFKAHRNGHWYFCLRDSTAQIRCVVWNRDQRRIPAPPDDGMLVAAFGRLTVYPARGEMQFTIVRIEAEGDGLRRKALEITRARLAADGLLAPERKRALPRFPKVIAVVTSPDGAALHDIVAVVRRRRANVRLVVVPAAVQGDSAPDELCYALDQVNRWRGADLVIVSRGGGSREDMWAFNNERVARALAACYAPTISAVGHEVDLSSCDLVADHRAPTPSAAAETATQSKAELETELRRAAHRLNASIAAKFSADRDHLRHAARDLVAAGVRQTSVRRASIERISGRLHALSPLATMARGYSVARGADGRALTSVGQFTPEMPFDLVLRDGIVPAKAWPRNDPAV
ncbi:MAG TPA: exodeoxyribonuclease VII large subunit [Gemmatimonadaceae bacterium]